MAIFIIKKNRERLLEQAKNCYKAKQRKQRKHNHKNILI